MADRTTRIEIRWGNVLSFLFVSLASPVPARSFYTSALTSNSLIFCRSGDCSANNSFYYQPIGFMTATSGEYDIRSNSSVDTVGYIFDSVVHQVTNVSGAILFDDESGGNYQFAMTISLRAMFNYNLDSHYILGKHNGTILSQCSWWSTTHFLRIMTLTIEDWDR